MLEDAVIGAGGARRRAKKVVSMLALAAVVAIAGLVSSAASFTLPLETTMPVETTTVALTTPTVAVTVPTDTVQTPTVPIATPTTPTVTATVTSPVPLPVPTVATELPTATVSASAPSVTVSGSKVSVGTSSVSSAAPSGSGSGSGAAAGTGARVTGTAGTTGASSGGSGGLGAPGSGASGPGAASTLLGGYGAPRVNSGMPPLEGRAGSRARARIASREHALKAIVARFQGCLGVLPDAQRKVLELRVGVGTIRPLSPRAVAARMHLGVARVTRLERQAVAELRSAAATHSCGRLASFIAAVASYFNTTFGGPAGTSGVEGVSYDLSPAAASDALPASPRDEGLLGGSFSAIPGGMISLLLLVLTGVLALTAIVADATGRGPRHAEWRHRMRSRLHSWH
jgi:Sigma-70, region 4